MKLLPFKKKKKLHRSFVKQDKRLKEELKNLRSFVETINRTPDLALRGGVYKEIAHAQIFTLCMDGVEVGYKVEEHGLWFKRKIFVKFPGYKFDEIPDEQRDPIVMSVFAAMLDRGQRPHEIEIIDNGNCLLVEQEFMPLTLVYDKNLPRGKGNA